MSTPGLKRDRPTIGVLAGWSTLEGSSPDYYRASVIRGIQSVAHHRQCHLLVSWGIRPFTQVEQVRVSWPVVSPGSDFVPVGPWNTDGLIVFTPLASEERSRYVRQLITHGFPVLFIGSGEPGPAIFVDNSLGIHHAVAHLVDHGHRRIAFIAGLPGDEGDSAVRLKAYHEAIAKEQLEADPALVVWGWHDFAAGQRAMHELLASDVKFTAVLASNDNSAVGALRAIGEAGLHVPRDIAVMGFDDQPIATAQVPPLSSVHASLDQVGEQALVSMLDHLTRKTPLESIETPPYLMKRQSCGCLPEAVASAIDGLPRINPVPLRLSHENIDAREMNQRIVNEMLNALMAIHTPVDEDEFRKSCTAVVEAFYTSLQASSPLHFQEAFMDCLQALEKENGSLEPWQEMLSTLRREMTLLPLDWDAGTRHFAEDLLHQARAMVGESAQRQDRRHQNQRAVKALALNELTAALSAVMSEAQVADVLETRLAQLGIRHAHAMFFESEQADPVAWSVVLEAESGRPARSFRSRDYPPAGLYPQGELLNVLLLPLVFHDEVLGYVAFDSADLGTCAVIAMQLAATIKVSRLHAQVVELSLKDDLTGLQNRRYFELFLKNEISRTQRFSRNLAVILVDVDHFKEYNDAYGHPAGDEALQRVARCLTLARRSADIVARIGGDEFVLVLPETDAAGALEVCRKIRTTIAEQTGVRRRAITVSMGLTALVSSVKMDSELMVKQADNALYESKRRGRNRISAYTLKGIVDEKEFRPPS